MRALSLASVVAASFGAFIAYLTYGLLCAGSDNGSCGADSTAMKAQLVIGLLGLIPVGAMVYFSFKGSRLGAVVSLVVGLLIWAGWAVLNDAAVHGWDSDMVLVQFLS